MSPRLGCVQGPSSVGMYRAVYRRAFRGCIGVCGGVYRGIQDPDAYLVWRPSLGRLGSACRGGWYIVQHSQGGAGEAEGRGRGAMG